MSFDIKKLVAELTEYTIELAVEVNRNENSEVYKCGTFNRFGQIGQAF